MAAEFAEDIEAGEWTDDSAAVVFRDRLGKFWLAEGFIRFRAHQLADRPSMRCDVREGDRRAAALHAAASNRKNSLRRTNADKRRSVEIVLRECPEWADRRIANHAGVSHVTVGTIRRELATGQIDQLPRVGLDGRERALPTYVPAARQDVCGNHATPANPARQPALGAYAPGPLPPPDPRSLFEAQVMATCARLDAVRQVIVGLAASPFGNTCRLEAACKAVDKAVAALWHRREGQPVTAA